MLIKKNKISNFLAIFLFTHALIWTLIPSLTNSNLPLDTIEALAWASDFKWGYSKHPPLSAWFAGLFFEIFSNQDWAYYFLSQLFVILSFIVVWRFSQDFFQKPIYSLISVLLLEGIYFYNFTTPEFNVYVCELFFWSLAVFYCWKGIKQNDSLSWLLFGLFAGLGILSHYLFFYLIFALGIFLIYMLFKKNLNFKWLISVIITLIVITPHLIWLKENNFTTIIYALHRTGLKESSFFDHIYYPLIFLIKQLGPLCGFFLLMFVILTSNFKFKINYKDKKLLFLLAINIIPIVLLFLTSLIFGSRIRTMWMTPFYLFFGVFFVYLFQTKIEIKRIKSFIVAFLILFFISPSIYYLVSITKTNARINYPGKEISKIVQDKWDSSFSAKIKMVVGNEWDAGNLSYNLKSRPKWKEKPPQVISSGIVVIGNYDDNRQVNEICASTDTSYQIVLFQIKSLHNVCMIGRK